MLSRHVDDQLLSHCEGELDPETAQSVTRHLHRCHRCARRQREIRLGLQLLGQLQAVPMPESRAEAIRQRLREPAAPHKPTSQGPGIAFRWQLPAAATALVVAMAGAALYVFLRPAVSLRQAVGSPSTFEAAARSLHLELTAGATGLDLETDSPREARRWILERTGLDAKLAVERPAQDADRFRVEGVKLLHLPGAEAGGVSYRIDSRPVTLVVAKARDVPEAPAWGLFAKKILYRRDAERNMHLLTWTSSGQTYTLVSDLPRLGRRSCLICHTDPGRRRLIEKMSLEGEGPRS